VKNGFLTPQAVKDIFVVMAILLVLVVARICMPFVAAGWVHSKMMNDPVRPLLQERVALLNQLSIPIVVAIWGVLSTIYLVVRGAYGNRAS
jgi:hypothetical protein